MPDSVIVPGHKIRFTYKGVELSGIIISTEEALANIKMSNGYNITIPKDEISVIESEEMHQNPATAPEVKNKDAVVDIIATGGTIASRVDYRTGAVTPVTDSSLIGGNIPNLSKFPHNIFALKPMLSENMTPEVWAKIARKANDSMKEGRSVIILHGTDTMAYTASALSFMFQGLRKPLIMVGSQRSSDRPSTDAFPNLEGALEFSSRDIGEVGISMHQNLSDNRISLVRGVRARKMHSSRRDAFHPMGEPPMAIFEKNEVRIDPSVRSTRDDYQFNPALESSVSLIYFHPMLSEDDFLNICEGKKAVVIAGTGLGHVGSRLFRSIGKLRREGVHFGMVTQCLNGKVDMNVYSTGRELLRAGVIPLSNMLPEVALVKFSHVLANYDTEKVDEMMVTNLRGEIIEREGIM